jgi:hypothetical protein
VATFLVRTGKRQCTLGEGMRLFQAASQRLRLPQGKVTEHLYEDYFYCGRLFQCLREQRHGIGDAPAQRIRRPQGRSHLGEPSREVHFLTDAHGPFELREGPGQVALAEGQQTKPVIGTHKARGVRHRLGNLERFFPEGTALSE